MCMQLIAFFARASPCYALSRCYACHALLCAQCNLLAYAWGLWTGCVCWCFASTTRQPHGLMERPYLPPLNDHGAAKIWRYVNKESPVSHGTGLACHRLCCCSIIPLTTVNDLIFSLLELTLCAYWSGRQWWHAWINLSMSCSLRCIHYFVHDSIQNVPWAL